MTITATKTDATLKTDVLAELACDTTVDETEVGVQVKNGIVTLTGTLSSYPKKLAAIDAAHRVYGVLDVVDDMKVKVPAIWERTDERLASDVRHALQVPLQFLKPVAQQRPSAQFPLAHWPGSAQLAPLAFFAVQVPLAQYPAAMPSAVHAVLSALFVGVAHVLSLLQV